MRKLTAEFIFTIASDPVKNGVIILDNDGTIIDVSTSANDHPDAELFEGIICPGFINTHCHLELSHMRNQLQEGTGMANFIRGILSQRSFASPEQINKAISQAETEMITNGIVAVADISNTNDTFQQKAKGNIHYHTFIEIFNPNPSKAQAVLEGGLALEQALKDKQQKKSTASIVPHAPYTMSRELLQLIDGYASKNNSTISIHNQESPGEDELFVSLSGPLFDLFKELGFDTGFFRQTHVNALRSTLPHLLNASKILFVHNTYTSREDILWAEEQVKKTGRPTEIYWCTCPNANLYIENRLLDYSNFLDTSSKMTVGTDSLASNRSLSVLDELKTISNYNPSISLQTLLTWATKNGADFLGLPQLGTIEGGKKPGLNLLKKISDLKISAETEVVKLV